jgi:hypothetical protein
MCQTNLNVAAKIWTLAVALALLLWYIIKIDIMSLNEILLLLGSALAFFLIIMGIWLIMISTEFEIKQYREVIKKIDVASEKRKGELLDSLRCAKKVELEESISDLKKVKDSLSEFKKQWAEKKDDYFLTGIFLILIGVIILILVARYAIQAYCGDLENSSSIQFFVFSPNPNNLSQLCDLLMLSNV